MALSPVLLPFYGQFAAGYKPASNAPVSSLSTANGASASANVSLATSSNPIDVVDIRSSVRSGTFTAAAGDLFSLGDLYTATAPSGSTVAGYKVALRRDAEVPDDGQLLIGDKDVTSQLSFTADEFSRLHFKAGHAGSQQDLVVVAQLGTRLAGGVLSNVIDSPAVQITASVTGTRSINAVGALLTRAKDSDANFVNTAQEASIFTGFGQPRPSLATLGNLTAAEGDLFSLGDLYTATAPAGSAIAGYKVALRRDPEAPDDGQLLLGDKDVTGQLSFTADEFSRLHFKAGHAGSQQDLVVVAQLGTRLASGVLSNVIDSPAVQITASVTGTRSINAVGALLTRAKDSDANFVNTAQEASIFNGFGQPRPSLATVGLPYAPQTEADLLMGLLGTFQSTERVPNPLSWLDATGGATPSTTYQVHPQYIGAVGARQTTGSATTGRDQGAASWTLSSSDLGGYQTGGNSLKLNRFAVAAYQASQKI